MPEIFIRKIEPGELMPFGGGNGMVTPTEGGYPFRWERFKTMARGQLRKIGESGTFSEQNMADVNGILGELVRRNKSPLHSLFKSGASLLMEKLPADIVARPELPDGEKEAVGYILALQNALEAREKSNGDRP